MFDFGAFILGVAFALLLVSNFLNAKRAHKAEKYAAHLEEMNFEMAKHIGIGHLFSMLGKKDAKQKDKSSK